MSTLPQISRLGAHGILIKEGKVLLSQKKAGAYLGLWGLPGGKIEFGETPEQTLIREFLEETAMAIEGASLMEVISTVGEFQQNDQPFHFHHVGIIFKIERGILVSDSIPEEKNEWFSLTSLDAAILTPFAKKCLL